MVMDAPFLRHPLIYWSSQFKVRLLDEVKQLDKQAVLDLLGIDLGPVRLKCALLSLKVLKAGVYGLGEASDDLVE